MYTGACTVYNYIQDDMGDNLNFLIKDAGGGLQTTCILLYRLLGMTLYLYLNRKFCW